MNAEQLLAHYERMAEAPDAIARLRRFVLDLARRGRLVEQYATEGTAVELLEHITSSQAELGKRTRKKTDVSVGSIPADAAPFALPASWRWTLFADLVAFSAGRTPARADHSYWNSGEHAWVSIADMEDGGAVTATKETVSEKAKAAVFKSSPSPEGTIIMSFKLTIGKISRLAIPAFHNEAIISIFPHQSEMDSFLFHLLPMLARSGETKGAIKGATLNRESISNILVPLPPLAEQHRIVAKVDELMALCDRLEEARKEREAARDRLTAASLARLNAPDPDPATFTTHARFALDNLPALTTSANQIKQLRQTILNLAVRGMLVAQNRAEEGASKLLARLGVSAFTAGDFSQQAIASGWEWTIVGDCFVVSGGIQKTPARTPRDNAFPYLGVGNVYRNRLDLTNVKKFELAKGELDRFRLEAGDILVVEGNGSATEIGRCSVWGGEIENCVHQNHLIRCRPKELAITPYVALFLNSPDGMAVMKRLAITSAGLYSLSVGKIRKIQFPLPPLAEQHRIVAKVDELMALCDRLEASLAVGDETRKRLLEAVLHEALEPAEVRELELA